MLKALADDTRWALVTELLRRPSTVTELTDRLHATQYNVSKHLRILREAGVELGLAGGGRGGRRRRGVVDAAERVDTPRGGQNLDPAAQIGLPQLKRPAIRYQP